MKFECSERREEYSFPDLENLYIMLLGYYFWQVIFSIECEINVHAHCDMKQLENQANCA